MRPIRVPAELLAFASTQYGLVTGAQCDEHGLRRGTRAALVANGSWSKVARDVFDVSAEPAKYPATDWSHRRNAVMALLATGPESIAVGASALALLGVQGLPPTSKAAVAVARGRSARPRFGAPLHQFDVHGDVVMAEGRWRVADPRWALAQVVPEVSRSHAVSLMDSIQNLQILSEAGLSASHGIARGRRGVDRTHKWWSLSDGRAESPLETRVRLECRDFHIPADVLQFPVEAHDGRVIGYGDLAWDLGAGKWLVAEADGVEVHGAPDALFRDRWRANEFAALGVHIVRFTWRDLAPPGRVAAVISRQLLQLRHAS